MYFNLAFFRRLIYIALYFQPNREDEFSRIEAAGGKVIYWDGYRVLGVLAMSRSIGKCSLTPSLNLSVLNRASSDIFAKYKY